MHPLALLSRANAASECATYKSDFPHNLWRGTTKIADPVVAVCRYYILLRSVRPKWALAGHFGRIFFRPKLEQPRHCGFGFGRILLLSLMSALWTELDSRRRHCSSTLTKISTGLIENNRMSRIGLNICYQLLSSFLPDRQPITIHTARPTCPNGLMH